VISTHRKEKSIEKAIEPNFDVDSLNIFSSLDDTLIAFDIPQFDVYIPSLCKLFASENENKIFKFVDPLKRHNIAYSYEREDRLNSFYGKKGIGVMSMASEHEYECAESVRVKMIELLKESFFSFERDDALLLRKILGDAKMHFLMSAFNKKDIKKENTDQLIRILGMLYQTVEWSKIRELDLVFEK
jgi:hypothetical protein